MGKIVFGLIGIIALYLSFSTIGYTIDRYDQAIKTVGSVVTMEPVRSDEGVTYAPVISFAEKGDDTHYQFRSNSSANPPAYDVGESVNVVYQPGHPEDAEIDSLFARWAFVLISGCLGVVFLGAAIICQIKGIRIPFTLRFSS